jgi:hypothetical protein
VAQVTATPGEIAIGTLRASGGHKRFLPIQFTHPEQLAALRADGFQVRAVVQRADLIELVDHGGSG